MTAKALPVLLRRLAGASLATASLASLVSASGCAKATAAEPLKPRSDLELTIYKQDFALVHDTRSVNVSAGSSQVRLPGVSKQLDPESVLFDWNSASHPEVVSTTYNVGVSSSQELMKQLVGQDVDVVWRGQDGKESDRESGRLEEAGQGTVLHTQSGYLIDPTGEVVVPGNRSFATMPELVANLESPVSGAQNLRTSYLTRGLSWSADYVAMIAPDGKSMRLECWGTVTNETGTDFPAARLKLVAGDPNRAVAQLSATLAEDGRQTVALHATRAKAPTLNAPFLPTGDLYTYSIPSEADISQGQMNRARIFEAAEVPIVRNYSIALDSWMDATQRRNATVSISFTNGKGSGLGLPLPAGSLRAYDSGSGTQDYLGAAGIGDTPKDERVALTLSDAFDIYAKSVQTAYKHVGRRNMAVSFESTVYNEKRTEASVRVVQNFQGAVKVETESAPSKPLSFSSREWTVHVPAGGRVTLDYTVMVKG